VWDEQVIGRHSREGRGSAKETGMAGVGTAEPKVLPEL
jgi:hypothetical protein